MNTEVYERFVDALQADFEAYVEEANKISDENPELNIHEVADKIDAPREVVSAEEMKKYADEYDAALLYVTVRAMSDALFGKDTEVSVYSVEV